MLLLRTGKVIEYGCGLLHLLTAVFEETWITCRGKKMVRFSRIILVVLVAVVPSISWAGPTEDVAAVIDSWPRPIVPTM